MSVIDVGSGGEEIDRVMYLVPDSAGAVVGAARSGDLERGTEGLSRALLVRRLKLVAFFR